VLNKNKKKLQEMLLLSKEYLQNKLKLNLKNNWQISPIKSRGIDFLGYVFYPNKTEVRRKIEERFRKNLRKINLNGSFTSFLMSYFGWFKFSSVLKIFISNTKKFSFLTDFYYKKLILRRYVHVY
jgi:RNA-directed DNA polymerase